MANLTATGATIYTWNSNSGNIPNPNQVTLTTIGLTSFTVTGTDLNGCANTQTASIAVNELPIVTITGANTTTCLNNAVNLTASGATNYTWSPGGQQTPTINDPATTPGLHTYTVTGTDANGCKNSNNASFTVMALPNVMASINKRRLCVNETVVLDASGATSYTWNPGNQTSNTLTLTPTNLGLSLYNVVGTDANGCQNKDTVSFRVLPLPQITASISALPCRNEMASLTATGANTYTWFDNVGFVSNPNQVPLTTIGLTSFTVTGTDLNGCANTQTTSITVNELPIVTIAGSNTTACLNTAFSFTASGADTYTWSPGGQQTPTIRDLPTTTGVHTYGVIGQTLQGCRASQNTTVDVLAIPILSISALPAAICLGQSSTLLALGAATYTWVPGDSIQTSIQVTPVSSGSIAYRVNGRGNNGCVGTQTVSLLVHPLPTLTITPSNGAVCLNDSLILTARSASSVNYVWSPLGVSTNTLLIKGTSPGTQTFQVRASSAAGCSSSLSVPVLVRPLPLIQISSNHDSICERTLLQLSATGAQTYTWSPGAVSGSNYTDLPSPAGTKTYLVKGTDLNQCSSTKAIGILVLPTPSLTLSGQATSLCVGDRDTITVSGASTYSWLPGSISTHTFEPFTALAGPQQYTVTGTDNKGCLAHLSFTNIVHSAPTLQLSSSSFSMCLPATAMVTAQGANTYRWMPGNTTTAMYTVSPTNAGLSHYTVTGTSIEGCVSSETVTVTAYAPPSLHTSVSSVSTCVNGLLSLSASGANSYVWNPGGYTGSVYPLVPTISGSYHYTVTGTDAQGCSSNAIAKFDVYALPKLQLSVPAISCVDSMMTLNVSGALSYTWNPGSEHGSQFTTHNTTPGTHTYTVAGSNSQGCVADTSFKVDVYVTPVLSVTGNTMVCSNTSVDLVVGGADTYTWSTGGNSAQVTVSPTVSTVYYVAGGVLPCANTASIAVNVYPVYTLTATATPSSIFLGQTTQLASSSILSQYMWEGPGSMSCNNCPNPEVKPSATSIYTVSTIDSHGCISSDTVLVKVDIRCGEVFIPDAFSPNSDSNNDTWRVYGNCIQSMRAQVFDRWGKIAYESNDPASGWDGRIDGQEAYSGVFVYQVSIVLVTGETLLRHGNVTLVR